jgi:hypothetical protein
MSMSKWAYARNHWVAIRYLTSYYWFLSVVFVKWVAQVDGLQAEKGVHFVVQATPSLKPFLNHHILKFFLRTSLASHQIMIDLLATLSILCPVMLRCYCAQLRAYFCASSCL